LFPYTTLFRSVVVGPAVDVKQDGPLLSVAQGWRPDVDVQAVFALWTLVGWKMVTEGLIFQPLKASRDGVGFASVGALLRRARRPLGAGLRVLPCRDRLRSLESRCPRIRAIGNSLESHHLPRPVTRHH